MRALGHVQQCQQAENVVADRFFDIVFHDGHVLVSSGMEDDLDSIGQEYFAHALRVAEVGNTKRVAIAGIALAKLMLQVKDTGFILVEAHKKSRSVCPYLAA